ncbi:MAG: hypothetical protein DHS20C03_22940 [Minwuia thermotolerans]|nr:MAG: hypothetical protein DHS20C03_22940 [Minwuia thermotolerans]
MSAVIFSTKDDKHRIGTELSMHEMAAIGFVTVSWAQLEHLMLQKTAELCEEAGIPLHAHATSLSFKKRMRALRDLAKQVIANDDTRMALLDLLTQIGGAERSRNRITHGLWDWLPSNPDKLQASSYRRPYDFEEPFDFKKLIALAERIGQINFRLAYSGGKDEAMEEIAESRAQRGGHVSRLGMQLLQGKDISDLHPDLATAPTRKRSPRK